MSSYKSSQAVVNTRFYLLLGALVLAAVTGLGSTVAWLTHTTPAPDLSAAQPKGKAVAELTAAAFVTGRAIPVPYSVSLTTSNGQISAGNGSRLAVQDLVWSGFTPDVIENVTFERHVFDLTVLKDPTNPSLGVVRYQLIVPVVLPADGPAILGALPYLTAVTEPAERPAFDYGGTLNLSALPGPIEERLTDWATHWAADDRPRLQATTPDGNPAVEYVGLGGFESKRVTVLGAVPLKNGDWLVRARVELVGPSGFNTEVDMDVTVTKAKEASPLVVAWGPAGSGVLPSGHNSVKRN